MAVRSVNTPSFRRSVTLASAQVDTITAADQTFTIAGIRKDYIYFIKADSLEAGVLLNGVAYGSAANTLKVRFSNPTAGNITPASQTYDIIGF